MPYELQCMLPVSTTAGVGACRKQEYPGIAGWFLFLVFAGVGLVALPMDLVREWWGRPRSTIAKSEYLTRAMDMARKAKSVKVGSCQSGNQEETAINDCRLPPWSGHFRGNFRGPS